MYQLFQCGSDYIQYIEEKSSQMIEFDLQSWTVLVFDIYKHLNSVMVEIHQLCS